MARAADVVIRIEGDAAQLRRKEAQVKIVSNGFARGTTVLCDGVPLSGVTSVAWNVDVDSQVATAQVELAGIEVEVEGQSVQAGEG